ncbi:MAG: YqcI/YcgG family protein [Anaerolineae bacterium]|nr:YqcI/YcgG family protein [Gemmatimonadaceae bacterium]
MIQRVLNCHEIETELAAGRLSDWAERCFRELSAKVDAEGFPCTFGTVALRRGDVLFAFVDIADITLQAERVASALQDFTARVHALGTVQASMLPFAVFLAPPEDAASMDDYFRIGWDLLDRIHRLDSDPWPERVPNNPDAPDWSFCFGGVPLFVNFKTPLHRARRSRRMDNAFLLLFQARDGFDVVAGDTPQGRRARAIIRTKLAAYDDVEIWPALGYHGRPENRDWKEYFVPESNDEIATLCPFMRPKGAETR